MASNKTELVPSSASAARSRSRSTQPCELLKQDGAENLQAGAQTVMEPDTNTATLTHDLLQGKNENMSFVLSANLSTTQTING